MQINQIFIKHVPEDSLWIVRILSNDILKLRFVRIVLTVTLIYQMALSLIQIYFFSCVLSLLDLVKYSPVFFGMFYVILEHNFKRNRIIFKIIQGMLSIVALLLDGDLPEATLQNTRPWSLDSAGKKTMAKIKTVSAFWTIFVIVNLGLALITVILFVLPVAHDEDVFFAVYFFDKYFIEYSSVLNWIYRSTFFIVAFTMVNCTHLFLYGIQQLIFQIYLLVTHAANMTNVVQYNSEDDSSLLKNEHYQMEVENRIKFCIKKHVELVR
jgi:hypothetical protein